MNRKLQQSAMTLIALVVGLSILAAPVSAETIFVDRFDDSASATGCWLLTPNDCSLRGAIIRANGNGEDDTIQLTREGTYTLTLAGSGDTLGDLDITDNLIIEGGGSQTVIIDTSGMAGGDRAFSIDPEAAVTITDVWITNLGVDTISGSGGGIWNGGVLSLERVWISDMETSAMGGGIFNKWPGILVLRDCRIFENNASLSGAGIFNEGELWVFDSTIQSNITSRDGAGVFNENELQVYDSTIQSNIASGDGAGIFNENILWVTNSTIQSNIASGDGAGVFNENELSVRNSTIQSNIASEEGAGLFNDAAGEIHLRRSTLRDNIAYNHGGAASNEGFFYAVNCTFAFNQAVLSNGGAIFNAADLNLWNVTFFNNHSLSGTAIYNETGALTDLVNTIIDDDCAGDFSGTTSGGGNIERPGNTCDLDHASDQHVTVDLFSDTGFHGGSTYCRSIGPGSPAIDAGIDLLCADEDQRGHPRPIDADPGLYQDCDSGAFEYNPAEVFLDGFERGDTWAWSYPSP